MVTGNYRIVVAVEVPNSYEQLEKAAGNLWGRRVACRPFSFYGEMERKSHEDCFFGRKDHRG